MEHQDYMEQALALAREAAAHGEVPVGCVIVKDGKVIGRGRNRREEKQAVYSHAEMEAMAQANAALDSWRLEGCDLYVTLEPCPMSSNSGRNGEKNAAKNQWFLDFLWADFDAAEKGSAGNRPWVCPRCR